MRIITAVSALLALSQGAMGAVSRQDIAASVLTKSLKPAKTVAASDGETVTCGDHVAFKSERNGRYLSSSAGHLSTSSTSVTYNEIFTLHCVDKEDGDELERGDPVQIEALKEHFWVGQAGASGVVLEHRVGKASDEWDLFDSTNFNKRTVIQNNAVVSIRNDKEDMLITTDESSKLKQKHMDVAAETGAVKATSADAEFALQVVCPSANGKICSNNGLCHKNRCKCLPLFSGHACENKMKYATCHSVGDPHYLSFDGLRFNTYYEGEKILYADPEDKHGEVYSTVLTHWMNRNNLVALNQGVGIRRDNEYVTVTYSKDRSKSNRIQVDCKDVTDAVAKTGNKGYKTKSGLRIQRRGSRWEIKSPSGARISVQTGGLGQNIWLTILAAPKGGYKGLCGNFDGNKANDVGWPDQESRRNPGPTFIRSISLTAANSIVQCKGTFDVATLAGAGADEKKDEKTFVEIAEDPESDTKVKEELERGAEPSWEKSLSEESRKRVAQALKDCTNELVVKARTECKPMLVGKPTKEESKATGAEDEYPDCLIDICLTDNKEFVAEDLAAAEGTQTEAKEVSKDDTKVSKANAKAEKKLTAQGGPVGAPSDDE